jgi:hypothetical protein
MINRWKSIPKVLYDKIMLYQPIESPAMMAWDLAEIRLVTSNELEITGEIKLNDLFDVFEGEDETTLVGTDAEYYLFLLNDTE